MKRVFTVVSDVWTLAARVGDGLRWLAPSLARLTVGWIFFQSGWAKLHNLGRVTDYFMELGLPAPAFQASLAATTEFVCGALLLLGLATRLAAVPLIITMVVAIRTALWSQVDSLGSLFGLAEFLYIALLVWLGTHGAGPLSIDYAIEHGRGHGEPSPILDRRASHVAG